MKLGESARPRKNPVWLWVRILLLFALFVIVGLLPALTVIPASAVPSLADMQFSEGTISTKSVGRAGPRTMITRNGGDKEEFSCRENFGGRHTCIHPRYAGGAGQIHWFWAKMPLDKSYKFAAQIVVNGKVVRDRSTAIEELEETRVVFQFMWGPLAFLGFVACVFVMVVDKGTVVVEKQSRNESVNQ
ncbi:MAG TPA: hypothetical protein VGD45_11905 [Steroidobacter sp.]|uniref:hypothetical protein n=1 Tax=Steroidobacter sp. TaxID=1978227 RepID=UPI002EDAC897